MAQITRKKMSGRLHSPYQPLIQIAAVLSGLLIIVYVCGMLMALFSTKNTTPSLSSSVSSSSTTTTSGMQHHLERFRNLRKGFSKGATGAKATTTLSSDLNDDVYGSVQMPEAHWPMMIRDEGPEGMENIPHPVEGNRGRYWTVPKFWSSKPLHQFGKRMTRPFALKVGTCQIPDPNTGRYNRGPECPLHQRTIFVMIASYRDFQCRDTVANLYTRAMHPDRIRVAIVDQLERSLGDHPCNQPPKSCKKHPEQPLCKYAHLIETLQMDAGTSVGPVPARHIGDRMYRGEYYALQVDAHVSFTQHWEMSSILELEATGNEMAVISTYLSDAKDNIDANGTALITSRPIMCYSRWQEANEGFHIHHSSQPEAQPHIQGTPTLHPWWAAGFSFSRGHFIVNVPYDLYQPMVFSGEEFAVAVRGWSTGYDFYTFERSVCFHHYSGAKRKKVPTFWEHADKYDGAGNLGMRRLLALIHMNPEINGKNLSWDRTDEEMYGVGGVPGRDPEHLMDILGIDFVNKTMEKGLCRFVNHDSAMHKLFTPLLRNDGMGIDYSNVTYRYKCDPDRVGDDYY